MSLKEEANMRKIVFLSFVLGVMACAAKYNLHISPDGQGGYLRTYRSSAKQSLRTQNTGIERCTIQGSDVICRDLKIIHK